ncbi:hypothetical protein IGB42_02564 [Andreprevotia sp. IGB-42]|uniref:hypothetical protein n=1 Tax=Andreprevotia sp. IGB-42 TaxID=2497473 RepID=UPI00135C60B1|nr:hypothetical protein [Andreprevotia sp. IGB-42]KAF0812724.1 hypothetical protein IGB42_02564 [Andreprevotia sp. IGB-42]
MLPKPVYEALPFVYFGLGMLTMAALDSPAKYLSILLLVAAGGLVLFMRHKNRHKHTDNRHTHKHFHM